MPDKLAVLLDGGFVKKVLHAKLNRFPTDSDIVDVCSAILKHEGVKHRSHGSGNLTLFRAYFYDAPPYTGMVENPLDRSKRDYSATEQAKRNQALLDSLELRPDFAVRRGELVHRGWKLGKACSERIKRSGQETATLKAKDLVPDLQQKGVDLRIGLDVALLAVKRIVDIVALVTGDADLIPAMKLARKEGVRVYLETLGNPVNRALKVHADLVLG